ncbi:MAG: hypothetical protein AB7K68_00780 [Bacteriovoracia bacterium]
MKPVFFLTALASVFLAHAAHATGGVQVSCNTPSGSLVVYSKLEWSSDGDTKEDIQLVLANGQAVKAEEFFLDLNKKKKKTQILELNGKPAFKVELMKSSPQQKLKRPDFGGDCYERFHNTHWLKFTPAGSADYENVNCDVIETKSTCG